MNSKQIILYILITICAAPTHGMNPNAMKRIRAHEQIKQSKLQKQALKRATIKESLKRNLHQQLNDMTKYGAFAKAVYSNVGNTVRGYQCINKLKKHAWYYSKEKREYVLALRGTKGKCDIGADKAIGRNKLPNRVAEYFIELVNVINAIDATPRDPITIAVTGHSLGGFCAAMLVAAIHFPNVIDAVFMKKKSWKNKGAFNVELIKRQFTEATKKIHNQSVSIFCRAYNPGVSPTGKWNALLRKCRFSSSECSPLWKRIAQPDTKILKKGLTLFHFYKVKGDPMPNILKKLSSTGTKFKLSQGIYQNPSRSCRITILKVLKGLGGLIGKHGSSNFLTPDDYQTMVINKQIQTVQQDYWNKLQKGFVLTKNDFRTWIPKRAIPSGRRHSIGNTMRSSMRGSFLCPKNIR